MTVILLAIIAAGVWTMAAESIIFAAVRLYGATREHRAAVKLARQIRAAGVTSASGPVRLPPTNEEE